jgi:TPR repeat protein
VQIGRYEVLEELGRGGMGAVYKACDPATGRDVAIKVLLRGKDATAQQRTRFDREARALAKVTHRNVVRLLDVGEHEGAPFLVMEYHKEGSLTEALRSTRLSPALAVRIGLQIAAGLEAGHAQGVLHRDLKPDNVLLGTSPFAMLTDFGLAKDLDRQGETQRLSQSGVYLGTPGFWAPEQAAGRIHECGPATDVYGVGAVLYYALCGRAPIVAEGLLAILTATLEEKPPAIRSFRPEVSCEFESVIMRCLEKEPADRWLSATALREALLELETQTAPAQRGAGRGALALVLGAIGLVLVGAVLLLGQRQAIEPAPPVEAQPPGSNPSPPVDAPPPASNPSLASLVEQGSVEFASFFEQGRIELEAKRYEAALPLLRRAAEGGHVKAMANLGMMLANGRGAAKDEAEAVKWYRLAAEKGDTAAMNNLGFLLVTGRGAAKDEAEALRWWRRAAEEGHVTAMSNLGSVLRTGGAGAKDEAEATKWCRLAAEKGDVKAMNNLGLALARGRGVAKDEAEAVKWYRRAAEKGQAAAMNNLGLALATGRGVASDDAQAAKWYRLAAEKGQAKAMYNLGSMLEWGRGVAKDEAEAVKWYRLAAEKGQAEAMYQLGSMLEKGRGVAKDETAAVKLYRRAAEKGNAEVRQAALEVLERLGQ